MLYTVDEELAQRLGVKSEEWVGFDLLSDLDRKFIHGKMMDIQSDIGIKGDSLIPIIQCKATAVPYFQCMRQREIRVYSQKSGMLLLTVLRCDVVIHSERQIGTALVSSVLAKDYSSYNSVSIINAKNKGCTYEVFVDIITQAQGNVGTALVKESRQYMSMLDKAAVTLRLNNDSDLVDDKDEEDLY